MDYRPLGNTGLYVSNLCLGAMTFSREGNMMGDMIGNSGEEGARRMIDMALDAGINIIDTANAYSFGVSEEIVGQAIKSKRQDVIVATKAFFPFSSSPNALGVSRHALLREVEASLTRLDTDYIDLYQVHSFDVTTPLEETLRTLDDLVRAGKVRYIGLSNFAGWQIAKAMGISERLGLERFCSVQAYYSLVGRELEWEILPAARDLGLGVMVWSPLAGGFLSGKYTREGASEGRRTTFDFPPVDREQGYAVVDVMRSVAAEHDASVAQVALAWLLHQAG
ncbi:MAG: aldo/keto reductase, partial [Myxococcota bacterium]